MTIHPSQCRAARALLAMNQTTLATKAGISLRTVIGFEAGGRRSNAATQQALRQALEGEGIIFIDGDGPGARLKGPSDEIKALAASFEASFATYENPMPRHLAKTFAKKLAKKTLAWKRQTAAMIAKRKR
jgi:DNA-binding XRE family transcriptional regulator